MISNRTQTQFATPARLAALLAVLLIPGLLSAAERSYPYQSCFEIASRMHDVPVDLLLAVAATESAWDPDARSHANAHGIMQIQWPGTARHLGVTRVAELYNPCLNIELGTRYLRELLDANGGDVQRALASYNYGPGRISRSPELPDGAVAYASKVAGHQSRIAADSAAAGERMLVARGVVFESSTRARRFASAPLVVPWFACVSQPPASSTATRGPSSAVRKRAVACIIERTASAFLLLPPLPCMLASSPAISCELMACASRVAKNSSSA